MDCSIEDTSSSTSLDIALYCENSLVHAGEYLPRCETSQAVDISEKHSLGGSHCTPHIRSLEVVQPDGDPVQSGRRLELFLFRVRRVQPNFFIHVESHPHRAGSQVVPKRGSPGTRSSPTAGQPVKYGPT